MPSARVLALATVVGCAVAALGAPSASQAASEQTRETGVVTYITDGDTVDVDVAGDGTATPVPVRLLGVQAMEAFHPTLAGSYDACHAAAAREELRALVMGKTVQLRAMSASSTNRGRLLRSVWVQQAGVWVDVQRVLVKDSLVLPFPSTTETTHNTQYLNLAEQAAAAGQGMWDTTACGSGPDQDIALKLIVHWDADGDDTINVNDEWASIQNLDPSRTISLRGWWLRDSSLDYFYFPSDTTIGPGQRVNVRVGTGKDSATVKYWGRTSPIFDNGGDGAYLFDPQGDLRDWMIYPCLVSCTDPELGNLTVSSVSYNPAGSDAAHVNGEWVKVTNTSGHRINLRPYLVRSLPYEYTFSPTAYVDPGATVLLRVGKGTDTTTTKYWGKAAPILTNTGDVVDIVTYDDIRLACKAWGNKSC